MKSRFALLCLPIAVVACSASPPSKERVGATESALAAETLTCTGQEQRISAPPAPPTIVATLTDPNVVAQRLPDIVTHNGPLTISQGVITLSSAVFSSQFGFGIQLGNPNPIVFRTAPKLVSGPTTVELAAGADTYLREGAPNQNQGALATLRIKESGSNRALVLVDQTSLASSMTGVASATLSLTIAANGDNWGSGRAIAIYRLTQAWDEASATWNCPSDADLTNTRADCTDAGWVMGAGGHPWVEMPTASTTITNGQTGTITFDVTADAAFYYAHPELNFGWIIKKVNEDVPGRIELGSREAGTPALLDVTSTPPDPSDPWGPSYTATVQSRCTVPASGPCPTVTFSATVVGGRFTFPLQTGLGNWRSSAATTGPTVTFDRGFLTCSGSTPVLPLAAP